MYRLLLLTYFVGVLTQLGTAHEARWYKGEPSIVQSGKHEINCDAFFLNTSLPCIDEVVTVDCRKHGVVVPDSECGQETRPEDTYVEFLHHTSMLYDLKCGRGYDTCHVRHHDSSCHSHQKETPTLKTEYIGECGSLKCKPLVVVETAPKWVVSDWSDCTLPCGVGTQTRTVKCERENNIPVVSTLCRCESRPDSTRFCNVQPCQV